MKKRRLTWHFQGLYRKDQGKNSSAKDKNQDQPVKDKGFTSVLQERTRTNITAFISIILYELQPQPIYTFSVSCCNMCMIYSYTPLQSE